MKKHNKIRKQDVEWRNERGQNNRNDSHNYQTADDQEGKPLQHYGLITATTMIIGIVIGSGIFFKSDDILSYTGGNLWLSILVFCIGAFGIIFGSLSLTEFSIRTKKNGGVVGYFEDFISLKMSSGFGWFQNFVYFPTLVSVISWVAGIYTCLLFKMDNNLETQVAIGLFYMILFYSVNIFSVFIGGYFQNLSTFIKLIPLLGIAIISIFWTASAPELEEGIQLVSQFDVGFGWLAALAPIAFSFDGWVVATSITNEVKNPNKNMTIALVVGPMIVLGVYLMYFLGLNRILGAEYILSTGDDAVKKVGELLFGRYGESILLTFVLISVLGVINGVILGSLRMPYALASKRMLPYADKITRVNPRIQLSVWSCIISFVSSSVWMLIHYLVQKNNLLKGGDVSEISIIFSYLCYIILYVKVIKMRKDMIIHSTFKGIICPVFAIIGATIIFIGGTMSNTVNVLLFLTLCVVIFAAGVLYYKE